MPLLMCVATESSPVSWSLNGNQIGILENKLISIVRPAIRGTGVYTCYVNGTSVGAGQRCLIYQSFIDSALLWEVFWWIKTSKLQNVCPRRDLQFTGQN